MRVIVGGKQNTICGKQVENLERPHKTISHKQIRLASQSRSQYEDKEKSNVLMGGRSSRESSLRPVIHMREQKVDPVRGLNTESEQDYRGSMTLLRAINTPESPDR